MSDPLIWSSSDESEDTAQNASLTESSTLQANSPVSSLVSEDLGLSMADLTDSEDLHYVVTYDSNHGQGQEAEVPAENVSSFCNLNTMTSASQVTYAPAGGHQWRRGAGSPGRG